MNTQPWQERLAAMVETAATEAVRISQTDGGLYVSVYAIFRPADNGSWGEMGIISQADPLPAGWQYITPERFPISKPWMQWHSWLAGKMRSIPIIGDD